MTRKLSMRPSINLVISEPYITLEEFCRRTGYKEGTVRQMYRESGFKQQIDAGEWIVTTLTHSLNADSGFTTSIELEVKIDSLEME
ncbi:hypothetical protein F3J38_18130 [Pantoea sp. Acro-805]|uniref:Uncharacterized protein n=1 Tax=Candidatus Pantoea formicae TaxID=2608355 RepID=A0ABX0R487_9GAMM|nr:hypothetical protein [Pantoea formicae]MDF7648228.1 hypothetical protein [Erwiniaceae bacterium L1_54_3]NIF01957.1 hypothetical protein [Pantoea formicae]